MKLAISTTGNNADAPLDTRFGRADRFLIHDLETGESTIAFNTPNAAAAHGAGLQAAQTVVEAGAAAVITGHCGPKAFKALTAAKVGVYRTDASTVQEAIDLYKRNELAELNASDAAGFGSRNL